jgi:hypothetical protein
MIFLNIYFYYILLFLIPFLFLTLSLGSTDTYYVAKYDQKSGGRERGEIRRNGTREEKDEIKKMLKILDEC